MSTEREMPAPQADADLRRLARLQAATLADLLLLKQTQTQHLQGALYEKLWLTQDREDALASGRPVQPATALLRCYYGRLLPVLSPNQYSILLRLDEVLVAPFAPIATPYRYLPATRLFIRSWPGHRI